MTEVIGIVSGVVGVVAPALSQIEQLVDRCENFRKASAEFHGLKNDCNALRDSLLSLEKNFEQNTVVIPEDIQRFKSDADSVKSSFERAQERCRKVEKYFSTPGSDSTICCGSLYHLGRALLRFFFAGRIARECEYISRTVREASADGTELNRFLHIAVQTKRVENRITRVGARVRTMDKKTDTIQKEVKHVEVGVKAVNKKVDAILQIAEDNATDANDVFKPSYYVPDLSREILLDFSTCDAEGNPTAMEGKLKRALLNVDSLSEFSRVAVAVGAGGMGGVGKTNALLGLGWENEVCEHFKNGGIYFLSFGKDASTEDVIEQLALAVEISGGVRRANDIRASKTLRGAIAIVVNWFEERETLFLCDDLWETAESSVGYFRELKQLLTSRGRIRMVLSTRDQHIASAAGIPIEFGPREAEGDLSRSILLKYADICEENLSGFYEDCQDAIDKILRTCGGIPLTLGVAGRGLRTKASNCDGGLQTAIVTYAEELEKSTREMMTEDIEGYPNFCATVRTSLDMVDEWAQKKGIFGKTAEAFVCSNLFTRLNVFPRQSRVPLNAVKRLWGDTDEDDLNRILDKFVDLNLLSKRKDRKNGVSVGLHDLVLEYCVIQAGRDTRSYHRDFVDHYLTRDNDLLAERAVSGDKPLDKISKPEESRLWWSLSSDGYFPENVCRHLSKGGCVGELMALLCDVRWTAFRMRSGGLPGWKSDFESLKNAISELTKETSCDEEWDPLKVEARLVRDAVSDAWGYLQGNARDLGLQIYSRLFDISEKVWPVSRYLRSVRAYCEKPWLLPRGRYWPRPGTGASVELKVGVDVTSIATTSDARLMAVAVGEDVLVIDVESRTTLWRLAGHKEDVNCVCMSDNGAMIVSGSRDGSLRRWDRRTGASMGGPLLGHSSTVFCVAMTTDGAMIVSGSEDETLRRWDGRTGAAIGDPLHGHDGAVFCVAMTVNGSMIVSGSEDGTLRRWDGRNGAALGEPLRGHKQSVSWVAMSKDGMMIASGSRDGTLRRWDGRDGAVLGEPLQGLGRHGRDISCVAMSKDGAVIVCGTTEGRLRQWDGKSGAASSEPLRGHNRFVSCIAMSEDGAVILSGSMDGTLRRWDRKSVAALGEPLRGHYARVTCIKISEDGAMIVSGSDDETLLRWDGMTGAALGEPLRGHDARITWIGISKNGAMIVSLDDETLRRWDGRTGAAVGEPLRVHDCDVSCVAMNENGSVIATASRETIQLWDARTGAAIGPPVRNTNNIDFRGVEIDNEFVVGRSCDDEFTRWKINETCGLEDQEELGCFWQRSDGAECSKGSDSSKSWVVRESSHQLIWDGPTGVQVLATLPSVVEEMCFKRVSFRVGGIGRNDAEFTYTVGAVVAAGLSNGMFCIFHLVTE